MTHLMKLKTYGLAFSSLDGLFQRWFDAAHFEFEQMGMLNVSIMLQTYQCEN